MITYTFMVFEGCNSYPHCTGRWFSALNSLRLLLRSKYLQRWSWWSNILELCKIHWPNTRMATFENCISPSILTFVRVNRHNDQMEKFHCSQLWIEKGLKKILRIFLFGIPLTAAWVEHPESKSGKLDLW